ncbi:serine/threonine-protein kinase [Mycolicibacterium neoaurum]|uniref:serine/threonine-protein kinase n=1 Tax=Mycolicibacterium neoaurum TaxID=1795 RepID=UPI001F4C8213|nr:serine/threonine-protein kinase [Mycolicibacterium neoaurum]
MIEVGSVVAGYRIERVLGTGGMGTVFLAKNPTLPRYDALKVLSAEMSADRAFRERFTREADIVAQFDHPGIVSVYSRGETDGQLWIALQYVDGTDAEEALRAGEMTAQRAIHIVSEVAKALDYAHQRNVVHHDVKPANLLLSGDIGDGERVFLSDFGVARPIEDSDRWIDGAFTATLAYCAPEVINGQTVDGRADLYSLGCSLFMLLTGQQPFFEAGGAVGTVRAHLAQPQPRVSDHLPWATADLDAVIARAMAKDPAQRFSSAREFAAAAAAAVGQADPSADATAPHLLLAPADLPAPALTDVPPAPMAPPPGPSPSPGAYPGYAGPPAAVPSAGGGRGRQFGGDLPEFRPTQKTRRPSRGAPKVNRLVLLWSVTAVLIVLAGVLVTLAVMSQPESAPAALPAPTVDTAAQEKLMGLLPAGYPDGRCAQGSVPDGARAEVTCGQNADPGGPASGTFTLADDSDALQAAFGDVVSGSTTVVCPGNIQSPGAWRRNATPTVVAGTLYCGTEGDKAVIAWTTDSDRLLNVIRDDRRALESMYRWWASHS